MIKRDDIVVMRAIAVCFKPYLKIQEAMIYTGLGRTQLAKKCEENGVYKTVNGYYKRAELDQMLSGERNELIEKAKKLKVS